jgi:hypothetical protein
MQCQLLTFSKMSTFLMTFPNKNHCAAGPIRLLLSLAAYCHKAIPKPIRIHGSRVGGVRFLR